MGKLVDWLGRKAKGADDNRVEVMAEGGTQGGLGVEAGLATAEYAVATIAAVGFAGLLITLLRSDFVANLLQNIIGNALTNIG